MMQFYLRSSSICLSKLTYAMQCALIVLLLILQLRYEYETISITAVDADAVKSRLLEQYAVEKLHLVRNG